MEPLALCVVPLNPLKLVLIVSELTFMTNEGPGMGSLYYLIISRVLRTTYTLSRGREKPRTDFRGSLGFPFFLTGHTKLSRDNEDKREKCMSR